MKKISKKKFKAECLRLKPKAIAFKKKAAAFCKKHEKLRQELIDVISRVIKAGDEAHKFDDDFNDLMILTEGSETGSCTHEPVPGTFEYASKVFAWTNFQFKLQIAITQLYGRKDGVEILQGLEQFAFKS